MTKEEAINIIDCYDIGFYDLSGEKIPADKLAEAFDMAIEALRADRPQAKWIPCSERLPLPDENPVLVSWIGMTNIGWYSCGRWETGTRLPMDGVEAWMPMPSPYEVKE